MEILKIHAGPVRKTGEIDYEAVVKLSEGFNGADLRNVCTEAGMFAIRDDRDYCVQDDFMKGARKLQEAKKHESTMDCKLACCGVVFNLLGMLIIRWSCSCCRRGRVRRAGLCVENMTGRGARVAQRLGMKTAMLHESVCLTRDYSALCMVCCHFLSLLSRCCRNSRMGLLSAGEGRVGGSLIASRPLGPSHDCSAQLARRSRLVRLSPIADHVSHQLSNDLACHRKVSSARYMKLKCRGWNLRLT